MGVPGEGELVAVGVEKLKDAGLGRVEEGEAKVGVAVGGTGDGGVVVEVVVGVVDTCGGDAYWPYFEFVTWLASRQPRSMKAALMPSQGSVMRLTLRFLPSR